MVAIEKRCRLLDLILEMNLSWEVDLAISQIMKASPENLKEDLADRIIKQIENCKSEKEVIETLNLEV